MSNDSERLARAGDYVLGLMAPASQAQAERDMEHDPEFRAAVERLAGHVSRLDDTASPEDVPAGMWSGILARIANEPQEQGRDGAIVHDRGTATATPSRGLTRTLAWAASLIVALGLGYAGGLAMRQTPEPVVLVLLQTPENTMGAVFEAFADNSVRFIPLEEFEVPQDKVMQVWTLYDPAVGPVSLGTLNRSAVTTLKGQALPTPAADQLYEITLEPSPGSPTGKPTGPILVKGFAKRPAG